MLAPWLVAYLSELLLFMVLVDPCFLTLLERAGGKARANAGQQYNQHGGHGNVHW